MNGNTIFFLMHEDEPITTLEIEPISGAIIKIGAHVQKDLLPPGGNLSQEDLKRWWKRRAVPITQGHIKRILEKCGYATPQEYLVGNYGLSLTDHYWIKPLHQAVGWNEVNLFTNDFKDEIGDLQFSESVDLHDELNLLGKITFFPSASAQGELQKKWVIHNGIRYLIKGNYGTSSQQSLNEVLATDIHRRQQKQSFVSYKACKLDTSDGPSIGCICEDFSNDTIEFISAFDLASSVKKDNQDSEYEHFIKVCLTLPMPKGRGFLVAADSLSADQSISGRSHPKLGLCH